MADLMDANEAKAILGCDDAMLNDYVNSGQLRAQSVDGQLKVNADDVQALVSGLESDDGTIILSGDSEDLSIDLDDVGGSGELFDDTAATMMGDDDAGITFSESDSLEVVSFEDGNTQELSFDDVNDESAPTEGLTFTESNTAVMTTFDETMIDETMIDQTVGDLDSIEYDEDESSNTGGSRRSSARHSVHSQRYVPTEEKELHVAFPIIIGLTVFIMALGVVPYFFLAMGPVDGAEYRTGEQKYGSDDGGILTDLAANIAGFSVEPNPEQHKKNHSDSPFIKNPDKTAKWRYDQFLDGADKTLETRLDEMHIDAIETNDNGEPTSATANNREGNPMATYSVTPRNVDVSEGNNDTRYELKRR